MKLVILIVFIIALFSAALDAVRDKGFQERAEIYSRLVDCDYYKENEYNYTHFVDLDTLKDARPAGYLVRVPVYVIGSRDAHIILSSTNTPNRDLDFVYEILLGGWGNSRVLIRKRIQNYSLKDIAISPVISDLRPLKVVIEIANEGHIRVFTDDKDSPLISAYDPNPLQVKYMSFASFQGASVEYLYNCASDKTAVLSSNAIRKEEAEAISSNLLDVPLHHLVKKCQYEEHWEHKYTKYHPLSELKNTQAEGYLFRLPLLVHGAKDVHILLSESENIDIEKDPAYEIVIGGWGNTRHVIKKTTDDDVFEKLQLPELLTEEKQTKVVVQMTQDGKVEVFVGDLQYKPLIWVQDSKPLGIKYVSFASNDGSRSLFFHSCESDQWNVGPGSAAAHPLLAAPALIGEEALSAKCHHIHAWENKYVEGIKLAAVKGSQPDGFAFQIPLYVQGIRDAHILLTTNGKLDANVGYEFLIGGWGNTRSLIRKNGLTLVKVNEYNVLDENKPVRVIVEQTKDGVLRIYTDFNKSRPLLEIKDEHPITDINTISFTAYYRDLDFYYGCVA